MIKSIHILLNAKFHTGIQIGTKVLTSAMAGQNYVTNVELTDIGVLVTTKTTLGILVDLVPFTNVTSMRIADYNPNPAPKLVVSAELSTEELAALKELDGTAPAAKKAGRPPKAVA